MESSDEMDVARMWLRCNVGNSTGDMSQFGPNAPGYTWVRADDIAPLHPFPGVTHQTGVGRRQLGRGRRHRDRAGGRLVQGLFFAPFDLPQYGMNVTTLLRRHAKVLSK
jgi:hypothetical protein